jgi:sulfur-oxidizing protein SoxX
MNRVYLSCIWILLCFVSIVALAQTNSLGSKPEPLSVLKENRLTDFTVEGDAINSALGNRTGNPAKGQQIVQSRQGQCTLCHAIPGYVGQVGNLGPRLDAVGARYSKAQLRLRIVNESLINPQTIMPAFYKVDNLVSVDPQWRGLPIMDDQQIEDLVAYLATLK